MKYGETIFDILYLLFTIISGMIILIKGKKKINKLMGFATLILGLGDSFHLVPRILNYFIDKDFSFYLGIGKLVTSITMTIFYLFVYYIYVLNYKAEENKKISILVWLLAITRIVLCTFPQNNWTTNNSPLVWGIIRNIPFLLLGILIIILLWKERNLDKTFKNLDLLILLSFLFYIPVVVGTEMIPMLGMLMIPKTICYCIIIYLFLKHTKEDAK